MLQELFTDQRRYLDAFFDGIDLPRAEAILNRLLACKGVAVFTGVGKSGHIAEKIAATFVSTGTRASFLSPGHALHGDIGFLSDQDLLIVFSKSGESQELLDLLPYVQKKGAGTIAIVSQQNSRLAKASELSIVLPVERELCPFDLAPTTSTAVQLIFGDCLAVALMKAKQFSMESFALNHPAGFLGRKITLKVADLMLKGADIPLCKPTDRLIDVLHELSVKRCGCLIAVNGERELQGIFTDGDLRRSIQAKGPGALHESIAKLMTGLPKTIESGALAWEAMKKMEEDPTRLITVLPVVDQGRLVGLLRMHDILQAKLS
ncbi:MAG: KpsF/GutQ family sugar-phosphate isomerase [Verrucomicrobia bacterium]|nr:KpsF/GutQ family sugar-phosphate isomerase [Verrucomicrobiota bacterium]